jgi:hypothetical protein
VGSLLRDELPRPAWSITLYRVGHAPSVDRAGAADEVATSPL